MKRGKAEIPGGAQENASRHIPEDLEGGQQKRPGNEAKECVTAEEETVKPAFRENLKLPNVPYMLGLNFMIDLSYNIFYTSFPLHAIAVLGWDLVQLSLFYTILCGFIVIVQGPVLSWASKKYPESNLIIFGMKFLMEVFFRLQVW
jgi:MFS transporter, DHA1 family, tetracycline resistance protein